MLATGRDMPEGATASAIKGKVAPASMAVSACCRYWRARGTTSCFTEGASWASRGAAAERLGSDAIPRSKMNSRKRNRRGIFSFSLETYETVGHGATGVKREKAVHGDWP